MSSDLTKIFLFFLLITVTIIFFFFAVRVKGPRINFRLSDYLKDMEADSIFFQSLQDSLVPQEEIYGFKEENISEDRNFVYGKIIPKYRPLLYGDNFLPLEMTLYEDGESIPFKEEGIEGEEEISWDYIYNNRVKLREIEGKSMYTSEHLRYEFMDGGILLANTGKVYTRVELPSGLKEFRINAGGRSVISKKKRAEDFDYSAGMRFSIDGKIIAEVLAEEGRITPFIFREYLPSGWHKLEIAFINDIWRPEKGWDRNLLIKNIEVYDLKGVVYLKIKRHVQKKYLYRKYSLSYFRNLDDEDENNLIKFFKSRFKIKSLRNIIKQHSNIDALVKDVEIKGTTKKAIFSPAPTQIKLKVKVPIDGIKFSFGFGIMEEAWSMPGDGVEFVVRVDDKKENRKILFSKYINPKVDIRDRKWHRGEIDLRRYRGKEIVLIFETRGSPANFSTLDNSYDWAVWSD